MVVLTDQLCKFFVHHPFFLAINTSICVWNDGDQEVKHDNDKEDRTNDENSINDPVSDWTKFTCIKRTKHEFICFLHWSKEAGKFDILLNVVLIKNEESTTKHKQGENRDNSKCLDIIKYLNQHFNQVTKCPEDSEKVQQLKPNEKWSNRVWVPYILYVNLVFWLISKFLNNRQQDCKSREEDRNNINIVAELCKVLNTWALILVLNILIQEQVSIEHHDQKLDDVAESNRYPWVIRHLFIFELDESIEIEAYNKEDVWHE